MQIRVDQVTDHVVVALHGALDVRCTAEVRTVLHQQIEAADTDVVVDMSRVEVVDLTALRLLAVATRRAHQRGHRLTLRGCAPAVRRMLHLSRLARAVEVERTAITA